MTAMMELVGIHMMEMTTAGGVHMMAMMEMTSAGGVHMTAMMEMTAAGGIHLTEMKWIHIHMKLCHGLEQAMATMTGRTV